MLFWVCEDIPIDKWSINNTGFLLKLLFEQLKHFLLESHFPNYFIRNNNMIDRATKENIDLLIEEVESMYHDPLSHLLKIQYAYNKDLASSYDLIQAVLDQFGLRAFQPSSQYRAESMGVIQQLIYPYVMVINKKSHSRHDEIMSKLLTLMQTELTTILVNGLNIGVQLQPVFIELMNELREISEININDNILICCLLTCIDFTVTDLSTYVKECIYFVNNSLLQKTEEHDIKVILLKQLMRLCVYFLLIRQGLSTKHDEFMRKKYHRDTRKGFE